MGVGYLEVHPEDPGLGVRRVPQGMVVFDIGRNLLILNLLVCQRKQPFHLA